MDTFKQYIDKSWNYDGNSAKCLYGIFTGHKVKHNYPHDPDDLCRVLQMLRLVPEHRRQSIMQECAEYYDSKEWMAIYDNWNGLMDIFSKEWNTNTAPRTFDFMNRIYNKEHTPIETCTKKEE